MKTVNITVQVMCGFFLVLVCGSGCGCATAGTSALTVDDSGRIINPIPAIYVTNSFFVSTTDTGVSTSVVNVAAMTQTVNAATSSVMATVAGDLSAATSSVMATVAGDLSAATSAVMATVAGDLSAATSAVMVQVDVKITSATNALTLQDAANNGNTISNLGPVTVVGAINIGTNILAGHKFGYNAGIGTPDYTSGYNSNSYYFGREAGKNSSLSFSVNIGTAAGDGSTGGWNYNFGQQAGKGVVGSNNVCIGYGAGSVATTTSSVMLGHAAAAGAVSVENCVFIGNGVALGATGYTDFLFIDNVPSSVTVDPANTTIIVDGLGRTLYLGDPAGDVQIRGDITIAGHATLTDTAWQSVSVPLTSAYAYTNTPPTFSKIADNGAGSIGIFAWEFPTGADTELYFSLRIPKDYKDGTSFSPMLNWYQTDATAGDGVVWGLEYSLQNLNGTIANSTIILSTNTLSGVDNKIVAATFPDITGTGFTGGCTMHGRLFRDVSDPEDDYAQPAGATIFYVNYQADKIGSDNE